MKKEGDLRKNFQNEVAFSPFLLFDEEGGLIFHECPPCPKCDGKAAGEQAGAFECPFCGWAEIEKDSFPHGESLLLEGTWEFLKLFLHSKKLRWLVSEKWYSFYHELQSYYLRGRHMVSYTSGDYMWDFKEKKWFKFI